MVDDNVVCLRVQAFFLDVGQAHGERRVLSRVRLRGALSAVPAALDDLADGRHLHLGAGAADSRNEFLEATRPRA